MLRAGCTGLALLFTVAACTQSSPLRPLPAASTAARPSSRKIAHVVIIFQENRSTDDLFNGFPGADTVRSGLTSQGRRIALRPVRMTAPYDLDHTHAGFETEYAGGKMNGFDRENSGCVGAIVCSPADVRAYGFVPHDQIKPYFAMATQYAFADRMFQTNQGPSFPAHQYIVSGTSSITDRSSLRAAENTKSARRRLRFAPGTLVALIAESGDESRQIYPCFDRISLMELLDKKSLSLALLSGVARSRTVERSGCGSARLGESESSRETWLRRRRNSYRHCRRQAGRCCMGNADHARLGSRAVHERFGTVLGCRGRQRYRREPLLERHGDLRHVGRLGRLVRSPESAAV